MTVVPRIQLLPAALADQIAAGEVVERPASVVKELVENALDAGARRIEVEIERGGLGRIVVSDDGDGMSRDDAHLALRRHATSKLRSADELFRLSTFGFRGEALPSIASISELTLITRRADATAAYSLRVRGGEVLAATDIGAPAGTRVEVRALFANVPARLKFQKAAGTEASHIVEGLVRAALSAPEVHVRARVDGRMTLDVPPHRTLADRARAIMQRSAGRGARIASGQLREGEVLVEVHVAPPEEALQTARRVHLLVNRRVVRDRGLLNAVQLGFGDLLERGRHPHAVISISMPSADVDVNVHPQKLEVRLARPAEIYAAVRHAVQKVVTEAGFARAAQPYVAGDPETLFAQDEAEEAEYASERGRAFEVVQALAGDHVFESPTATGVAPPPRFLGALVGGYLLFADGRGMIVVDQHAASALVLASRAEVARMPAAIAVALDHEEQGTAVAHRELLESLGFALVVADQGTLRSHPVSTYDPVDALRELLVALVEDGPEEARARAVAFSAISPAATLDPGRASTLLADLRELSLVDARWRGRRAMIALPLSELTRRFDT